jgi:selenocysteine lyase/cysteine desulfurase
MAGPSSVARHMLTDDETYFAALREREFSRLDAMGHAYLDYTGSGLYAASLVRSDAERLLTSIDGNPHADPSMAERIECTREDVLRWLDADARDYTVIFTPNASGAIRLVGESYPFGPRAPLVLSADNHNSVNGLRRFARRRGAPVHYLPLDAELRLDAEPEGEGGLFAYPAQSNFSGVQHPLTLAGTAAARGFDVLLDAAAFVPTNALSLRSCTPAFVVVSFYKVFGYPTGIGALVVRQDALARLKRPWFAGGTVERVWVTQFRHRLKTGAEGFEDGTPNFLAAGALRPGLTFMRDVGTERLHSRVSVLARALRDRLADNPRVCLYGPRDTGGAVAAFNVRGVDFQRVEQAAREANIAVRSGCFCNPGAADRAGVMGAVRASLGIASNADDVSRLAVLLETVR